MLSENDFDAVLASFCCYDCGADAFEAVQKIATDQRVSQMHLVCYALLNSQDIPINQKQWKKFGYWDTSDVAKKATEVAR